MKTLIAALFMVLPVSQAFAQDLTLPGERWLAKFTGYVCEDGNTQTSAVPAALAEKNVVFGKASTDMSLDNILLMATFEENGAVCSYSSILFADNAAWTAQLVQSHAWSAEGTSCAEGKALLDGLLAMNDYKYLHGRAAIYVPVADAAALCSADSNTVGLHLQVTGRVQ